MMHQFPMGVCLNGEESVNRDTLRVKLPNRNMHIEFTRQEQGMLVKLKTTDDERIIGRNVAIKDCKNILAFLVIPHKELNEKAWRKAIRNLIPKKKRR